MLSVIMWLLRLYHAYIREILMKFLTHAQSKYLESCGSWQGKIYHIRKIISCIPKKNTNKCNKHGYAYISHSYGFM